MRNIVVKSLNCNITFIIMYIIILLIRLFTLMSYGNSIVKVGDNARNHYLPVADRLVSEGRFNGPESRPDSKVPPGYPLLLAVSKKISPSKNVLLNCALQQIFDFFTSLCLLVLGCTFGVPRVGKIAGLLWLLFPPALAMSCWITAENPYTMLLTFSITVLICSLSRINPSLSLVAGASFGVSTMFRGTTLWLPVFLLPLWIFQTIQNRFYKMILFLLGFWCVILPWTLRNWIVLEDPILVAVGSGSVFLQGSDERVFTIEGKNIYYKEFYKDALAAGIKAPSGYKESEIDKRMLKIGIYMYKNRALNKPLSFIPFFVKKFFRLWFATESGGIMQQLLLGLCSLVSVPLALYQVGRWLAAKSTGGSAIFIVLTYFILLHVVTLPLFRYIFPVFPIIIFCSCYSIVREPGPREVGLQGSRRDPSEGPSQGVVRKDAAGPRADPAGSAAGIDRAGWRPSPRCSLPSTPTRCCRRSNCSSE